MQELKCYPSVTQALISAMPSPLWRFGMVALVSAIQNNESNESDPNSDFYETNWTLPMLSPCGAQRPPETYEPARAHDPGPASLGGPSD